MQSAGRQRATANHRSMTWRVVAVGLRWKQGRIAKEQNLSRLVDQEHCSQTGFVSMVTQVEQSHCD